MSCTDAQRPESPTLDAGDKQRVKEWYRKVSPEADCEEMDDWQRAWTSTAVYVSKGRGKIRHAVKILPTFTLGWPIDKWGDTDAQNAQKGATGLAGLTARYSPFAFWASVNGFLGVGTVATGELTSSSGRKYDSPALLMSGLGLDVADGALGIGIYWASLRPDGIQDKPVGTARVLQVNIDLTSAVLGAVQRGKDLLVEMSNPAERPPATTDPRKPKALGRWADEVVAHQPAEAIGPFSRSAALIVGIDDYESGTQGAPGPMNLSTAVSDAKSLAALLRHTYRYGSDVGGDVDHDPDMVCLINQEATRGRILEELVRFGERLEETDRFLFYFAGHGLAPRDEAGARRGYLVPYGVRRDDPASLLSMEALNAALAGEGGPALRARHVLVILDCCFAGAFRWATRDVAVQSRLHESQYRRFVEGHAWQVLCSTGHDEVALDLLEGHGVGRRGSRGGEHSPFARALLRGLEGEADLSGEGGRPDGVITATELYLYLRDAVEPGARAHGFRQTPGLWPGPRHGKGEYVFLPHGEACVALEDDPILALARNPYRGADAYEYAEKDAKLFFGRQRAVDALARKVQDTPLTIVIGPSSDGKSSLVSAGLLPSLGRQGLLPNAPPESTRSTLPAHRGPWILVGPFRPGAAPNESLAAALLSAGGFDGRVSARMLDEPGKFADLVKGCGAERILLVVDALDDLVTEVRDAAARRSFTEAIGRAVLEAPEKLRVVATLRADCEARLAPDPLGPDRTWGGLSPDTWRQARFTPAAMTREEWAMIVERPAAALALFFESASVVDRLVDDARGHPGALPALSCALHELCAKHLESAVGRELKFEDYEAMGGVAGVLSRRAEAVYLGLGDAERATLKRLLLRTIDVEHIPERPSAGPGEAPTRPRRRRVSLRELEHGDRTEGERLARVRASFERARLLIAVNDPVLGPAVELAHDGLFEAWPQLQAWCNDQGEREALRQQRVLTRAAFHWKATGRDLWVLPGQFAPARGVVRRDPLRIGRLEAAFLRKSRIIRNLMYGATFPAVAALVAWQVSRDRAAEAEALAARALQTLEAEPIESLRMAVEADDLAHSPTVTHALRHAVSAHVPMAALCPHDGPIVGARFGRDGSPVTVSSNAITVWDLPSRQIAWQARVDGAPSHALLAKDAVTLLALRRDQPLAEVFSREPGGGHGELVSVLLGAVQIHEGPQGELRAVTEEGAGVGATTRVHEWRAPAWHQIASFSGRFAAASGDGSWVATARPELFVSSVTSPWAETPIEVPTEVSGCEAGASKALWWIEREAGEPEPDGHGSSKLCFSLRIFDGEGLSFVSPRQLTRASSGAPRPAIFLGARESSSPRIVADAQIGPLFFDSQLAPRTIAALAPDGGQATVSFADTSSDLFVAQDESLYLWRPTPRGLDDVAITPTKLRGLPGWVLAMARGREGALVAASNGSGHVMTWDTFAGERVASFRAHEGATTSVSFHPEAAVLLSAGNDGEARLWRAGEPKVLVERRAVRQAGEPGYDVAFDLHEGMALVSIDRELGLYRFAERSFTPFEELGPLAGAMFSGDGSALVAFSYDDVKLWRFVNGGKPTPRRTLSSDLAPFRGARFLKVLPDVSAKRLLLFTRALEGGPIDLRLWDVEADKDIWRASLPSTHDRSHFVAALSGDDGGTLLTAVASREATLWRACSAPGCSEERQAETLKGHAARVVAAAFAPSGRLVATADEVGEIRIWSTADEPASAWVTLRGHKDRVHSLRWVDDGLLVSAAEDGSVRVWDVDAGRELYAFWGNRSAAHAARLSNDRESIVVASRSGIVRTAFTGAMEPDDLRRLARQQLKDALAAQRCPPKP